MWRSSRSANARYPLSLVLSLFAVPLAAQVSSTRAIPYGGSLSGNVRVRAPSIAKSRIFGTVDRATPDTLVLRGFTAAGADTILAIPVAAITRLQVSIGTHRNAGRGLGIGLLAGGLAGAGIGALSCSGTSKFFDSGDCALILGVLGAGAGAVVGLIAGSLTQSDRWVEVPTHSLRVSVDWRGGGGGVRIGATFAF